MIEILAGVDGGVSLSCIFMIVGVANLLCSLTWYHDALAAQFDSLRQLADLYVRGGGRFDAQGLNGHV